MVGKRTMLPRCVGNALTYDGSQAPTGALALQLERNRTDLTEAMVAL